MRTASNPERYNFAHFGVRHFLQDFRMTLRRGLEPGQFVPDFELPKVGGGTVRLSSLRGQPVLLRFGSFT